MDNDNFVNLVQAIELKELGFREYCYQHYDAAGTLCDNYINVPTGSMNIITTVNILKSYNNYRNVTDKWDAPTLSQVHAWLRTNKFIDIDIEVTKKDIMYIASFFLMGIICLIQTKNSSNMKRVFQMQLQNVLKC